MQEKRSKYYQIIPFNKKNTLPKSPFLLFILVNSLVIVTLVALLVDARETLEPPISTQSISKLIKQIYKKHTI
jgi:hypothetical protein